MYAVSLTLYVRRDRSEDAVTFTSSAFAQRPGTGAWIRTAVRVAPSTFHRPVSFTQRATFPVGWYGSVRVAFAWTYSPIFAYATASTVAPIGTSPSFANMKVSVRTSPG